MPKKCPNLGKKKIGAEAALEGLEIHPIRGPGGPCGALGNQISSTKGLMGPRGVGGMVEPLNEPGATPLAGALFFMEADFWSHVTVSGFG